MRTLKISLLSSTRVPSCPESSSTTLSINPARSHSEIKLSKLSRDLAFHALDLANSEGGAIPDFANLIRERGERDRLSSRRVQLSQGIQGPHPYKPHRVLRQRNQRFH